MKQIIILLVLLALVVAPAGAWKKPVDLRGGGTVLVDAITATGAVTAASAQFTNARVIDTLKSRLQLVGDTGVAWNMAQMSNWGFGIKIARRSDQTGEFLTMYLDTVSGPVDTAVARYRFGGDGDLSLIPNPTRGHVQIDVGEAAAGTSLRLIAANGGGQLQMQNALACAGADLAIDDSVDIYHQLISRQGGIYNGSGMYVFEAGPTVGGDNYPQMNYESAGFTLWKTSDDFLFNIGMYRTQMRMDTVYNISTLPSIWKQPASFRQISADSASFDTLRVGAGAAITKIDTTNTDSTSIQYQANKHAIKAVKTTP